MDVILLTLKFPESNPVYDSLLPNHATCPTHLIPLNFITRTVLGEQYRSISSLSCTFPHSHLTLSLIGQNILLIALYSHTLSLRFSFNMTNLVSHPYKQRAKFYFFISQ